MKNNTPLFLAIFLISICAFSANGETACQSANFPSLTFSESQIFPKDGTLRRPEDGKAFADGRVVVGDEEFGLRLIEKDGKSRAFGKFKEAGWVHDPPKVTAGPNGIFMERDGSHLLLADVFTGKIYRVNVETEETKMIYQHPFGINTLVRDSRGTIWFTQSAKNSGKNSFTELFAVVNLPVDSGAVFYLKGAGDKFETKAEATAENIYFANGIALDAEEKYLYVAETMMNRILRFEIDTSKNTLANRETYQHLITPDNLDFDKEGNLFVASPITNKVFAIDKKCRSLHTVFLAPSQSNARISDEWVRRSHLGKPMLELFTPELWKPMPGGALTGMFWSKDYKTLYVTGLGKSILKVASEQKKKLKMTKKLAEFGNAYTDAWNSQKPENVASFFAKDGSLTVNSGSPLIGREAITEFARSFMTAFPDMKLTMDKLLIKPEETQYHWSFVGTNTGPAGNGNRVEFNGFERWTFNEEGLIKSSIGKFDEEDYNRQLSN